MKKKNEMKTLLTIATILLLFLSLSGCACLQVSQSAKLEKEILRVPGEFEKHEAFWIGWSTYENKQGLSTVPIHLEMIKEAAPFVKVKIAVQDAEEVETVKSLLKEKNIPTDHVSFHIIPHADIWFRDMGPIFVVSNKSGLKIADFDFNIWGYDVPWSEDARLDEKVDRLVAEEMGIESVMTRLISEGGDREFNGKGTMIAVEEVELQRNPNMSIKEIEDEFKRLFGVKKIIWLKKGVYEDDLTFMGRLPGPDGEKTAYTTGTTGGHIDEFCRFADADTILLAEVTPEEAETDPIAKENYLRLKENFEILKNARDQDWKLFEIIRMPMPEVIYDTLEPGDEMYEWMSELEYKDGSVFPKGEKLTVIPAMSYLNYAISNGIVFAQKYWKPGLPEIIQQKDEQAIKILQSVFPDRKIVPIDPMAVNLGGGGLHCITQQEPAVK